MAEYMGKRKHSVYKIDKTSMMKGKKRQTLAGDNRIKFAHPDIKD